MLTDVAGVRVGHWHDTRAATGCTVIIPPPGTVGGVDVRGGGPGTRETELLSPLTTVSEVTALLLTGGSAFGLAAAAGVTAWCEREGLGFDTGRVRVPIVPAAVIYDLGVGDPGRRPGAEEGEAACRAARGGEPHAVGSVGAGTGASVGKLLGAEGMCKGGLGAATMRLYDGCTVSALAVVNAFGDVLDERARVLAGAFDPARGFIDAAHAAWAEPPSHPRLAHPGLESTTLVCVATDARLTKPEAGQVARMAQTGMARAVAPVHTRLDGDVVFCLATGARPGTAFACGAAAAAATAAAIRDAVRRATAVGGVPTAADRLAGGARA